MFQRILIIALRLFLGGMMVYGGVQKFSSPLPTPLKVVEKAQKFTAPEKEGTLQKILYIGGAKQTGYFWQVLGICELLFGLLVIFQGSGFLGAVLLLPITLHIFLFHFFLEADEVPELVQTGGLFAINVFLVVRKKKKWMGML